MSFKSTLGVIIKILGILSIVGVIVFLNDNSTGNGAYNAMILGGGIINCILFFGIARCVDAATIYLKEKESSENVSTSGFNKPLVVAKEEKGK